MSKSNTKQLLSTISIAVGLSVFSLTFQNCSNVEFGSAGSTAQSKAGDNNTLAVGEVVDPVYEPGNANTNPPVDSYDSRNPRDLQCKFKCAVDDIADIRVNISAVYLGQTQVQAALGVRSLMEMSNGFNVILAEPVQASQVRLVLAKTDNFLVDTQNATYSLKTPSAQQSGLKILLGGKKDFGGNTAYTIKFILDPDFQVVHAGKKCLLKPVFKATSVEEVIF